MNPVGAVHTSGGALRWNRTQLVFKKRDLLQITEKKDEVYYLDYMPPARDAITLPSNVVYVLIGVVLVLVATYAIVGHLIKDLMHDFADWILGPKPMEEHVDEGEAVVEDLHLPVKMMGQELMVERGGLLPGYHQSDGADHPPSSTPPLKSAIASILQGERTSAHSVTFACSSTTCATSL